MFAYMLAGCKEINTCLIFLMLSFYILYELETEVCLKLGIYTQDAGN